MFQLEKNFSDHFKDDMVRENQSLNTFQKLGSKLSFSAPEIHIVHIYYHPETWRTS